VPHVSVSPAGLRVKGNADQLHYVLAALLTNAVEAAATAEEPLVALDAVLDDEGAVGITVADNGPGLGDEARIKLFVPFFSTKPGGRGVSLANCRTIVEAHGGRIWYVEGHEGGACFRLTLPAGTRS